MVVTIVVDDLKENFKIREYLSQVDKRFYHRVIENRKKEGKVFPHRGEDGGLFMDTYRYVKIINKKK